MGLREHFAPQFTAPLCLLRLTPLLTFEHFNSPLVRKGDSYLPAALQGTIQAHLSPGHHYSCTALQHALDSMTITLTARRADSPKFMEVSGFREQGVG